MKKNIYMALTIISFFVSAMSAYLTIWMFMQDSPGMAFLVIYMSIPVAIISAWLSYLFFSKYKKIKK